MTPTISRFLNAALLAAALSAPVAVVAQDHQTQSRTYHDERNNDDHQWNTREDQAYRIWAKENHRKYVQFSKARPEDQQTYWAWRHDHSDVQLKINIH